MVTETGGHRLFGKEPPRDGPLSDTRREGHDLRATGRGRTPDILITSKLKAFREPTGITYLFDFIRTAEYKQ